MSILSQRQLIETYFATEFAIVRPDVPITGENNDFSPPVDAPWLRMSFISALQFKTCLGGNNTSYKTEGIFAIQVFTPLTEGSANATAIADDALTILREQSLADIPGTDFMDQNVTFSGEADGFYQINIFSDYRSEDS